MERDAFLISVRNRLREQDFENAELRMRLHRIESEFDRLGEAIQLINDTRVEQPNQVERLRQLEGFRFTTDALTGMTVYERLLVVNDRSRSDLRMARMLDSYRRERDLHNITATRYHEEANLLRGELQLWLTLSEANADILRQNQVSRNATVRADYERDITTARIRSVEHHLTNPQDIADPAEGIATAEDVPVRPEGYVEYSNDAFDTFELSVEHDRTPLGTSLIHQTSGIAAKFHR